MLLEDRARAKSPGKGASPPSRWGVNVASNCTPLSPPPQTLNYMLSCSPMLPIVNALSFSVAKVLLQYYALLSLFMPSFCGAIFRPHVTFI